jgi:transposase
VGAQVLYLHSYRPDLNPIERVFAKLKMLVRKLKLRNVLELWHKLGDMCDGFIPKECLRYFQHAGYKNIFPKQTYRSLQKIFNTAYEVDAA